VAVVEAVPVGAAGVGVAPGITVTGVGPAIVADIVPTGVGGSDNTNGLVTVQALIRTKAARATKTGWKAIGWIWLWRRPILRSLTIRLPTMLDAQDNYDMFIFINLIDNAIVTYADAPLVVTIT